MRTALISIGLAVLVGWCAPAIAASVEVQDRSAFRVCADPNNLPFSNQAGEGYENKIAELIAAELAANLKFTFEDIHMFTYRKTLPGEGCFFNLQL